MKGMKLRSLVGILIGALAILLIGCGIWLKKNRASLADLKLGLPTWRISIARAFAYDRQGHFAAQTQYLSRVSDADNGKYCVQCRDGKVTAIFVKYSPPLPREQSLRALKRLAGDASITERDTSEIGLSASAAKAMFRKRADKYYCPPSEYIYLEHGRSAELQYAGENDHRVTDLMIWG